ncbi:HPr family phosphocarrier protein [Butyrivibrio sp. M55]|jgi:phosphocarrier protein|uniref:HPr family phosphocarrier protein n=1 Tax=Butyrivibrio sp. M55 TaxID=1855323 RepID=UPI0008ECF22C|nr:HPr family phosphocarrier protein [Butyrivibrio sp. M55]SFU77048.1 phosphocarrier protein [Butyrivibrio sp. M55]
MVSKTVKIVNEQGMHMRPATVFSQAMMHYTAEVNLCANGSKYDGKSVMMLMAACIKCGAEVEITCDGPDEEEALAKAVELIESGLGD